MTLLKLILTLMYYLRRKIITTMGQNDIFNKKN